MMTLDVIKQAAFATGRILHQGTGEPVAGETQITAKEGPVVDKVFEDGTFILSGDLELLFPKLATQNYQLNLTIRADSPQFRKGFVEHQLPVVTIPMGSNFDPDPPIIPNPIIDVGTIALPADPINIRGRVVEAKNPDTPIPNATVEVLSSFLSPSSTTTNAKGRYRFDNINVLAPAQIRCSATTFKTQTRTLLIDFGKLINEEYFRLAPP